MGEPFPTEQTGETVTFLAHIERGFGVPTGDFFRGLLHHYSIIFISDFIHMCEAYMGIPAHMLLWRYFFELKKTGKNDIIVSLSFTLRQGMKDCYIDMDLPDNTPGWRQG